MQKALDLAFKAAATPATILLLGGKRHGQINRGPCVA